MELHVVYQIAPIAVALNHLETHLELLYLVQLYSNPRIRSHMWATVINESYDTKTMAVTAR